MNRRCFLGTAIGILSGAGAAKARPATGQPPKRSHEKTAQAKAMPNRAAAPGKTWIVAVGVNRYRYPGIPALPLPRAGRH